MGHEIQAGAQDSQDREGSAGAGQDNAERTGEERRDERDRGRAPSGHGPIMGRQVAQPIPEGGHGRPADPPPLRPPV